MKRLIYLCLSLFAIVFQAQCATCGIYAVKISTGEVLANQNGEQSFTPSSCMKVATTGAALHLLGPHLRFKTQLEIDDLAIKGKTLNGNLYIRGGGDPCLGSSRIAGVLTWKKQIETWTNAAQELGIKKIEGRVIGDASKWEKALAAPSWLWEDLGNYYGAGACALTFHENLYSIFFSSGKNVGDTTTILKTDPPEILHTLQNEVRTGPEGSGDQAWVYGVEYFPTQFIRGTIPAATREFTIKGAIPDPAAWCADLLSKELKKRGIAISGKSLSPREKQVAIHLTHSPTVGEIIYHTNQKSINLYAEHLLKKMGEVTKGKGSTEAGAQAVTDFWKSQGIDVTGFHMADGSGLSRKNMVTPKQLVEILLIMKKSKEFPTFFDSLPQNGSIRAKTGYMSFARSLAGYKGDIAFAILINGCSDSQEIKRQLESALALLDKAPGSE